MISKWEAGGDRIHPRPVNQAALDTFLAQSSTEVKARFELLIGGESAPDIVPVNQHHVRHPVDGKLMAMIDAGVSLAGADNEPLWLPAFYMDVYPTSNADYARFLAATGHQRPAHWTEDRWPDGHAQHPVVFVTWHDAARYAEWAGKALPTSQQWEKAARGTTGNTYPWGNQPTPAKCNVRESGPGSTTPTDQYRSGASQHGVYDLCGNVWEWCATGSTAGRYELKGGAFTSPFDRSTPSAFNDAADRMCDDDTGFRCATPAESLEALLRGQT